MIQITFEYYFAQFWRVLPNKCAEMLGCFQQNFTSGYLKKAFISKFADRSDSCLRRKARHFSNVLPAMGYFLDLISFDLLGESQKNACDAMFRRGCGEYLNGIGTVAQDAAHPAHDN